MTPNIVLWIYLALLLAGGTMGLVKAGSKMSLLMSLAFAVPLAICAAGRLPLGVAQVLLGVLSVFFGVRFVRGRKFMPGGLMMIVSGVALVLLFVL